MALFPTAIDEVRKIIGKSQNKETTSHDGISNEIIKCCSPVIEPYLVELFNKCLNEEKFPGEMKIAKVVLSFKKSDKVYPEHYRPISLLGSNSKVLESFKWKRMTNFSSQVGLFSENQHGFQKNRSWVKAIIEVTKLIQEQLNNYVKDTFVSLIFKKHSIQSLTKIVYAN